MEELRTLYRAYREYRQKLEADAAHTLAMNALRADARAQERFGDRPRRFVWDEAWISAMMEGLPFVERALDEQRRFIESSAEIRRIDQAKRTSVETIRHLAQHSNLISDVRDGEIIPDRVLIVEREDSYAIYENRFLHTLVTRMQAFLEERFRALEAAGGAEAYSFEQRRAAAWGDRRVSASIQLSGARRAARPDESVNPSEMTSADRVRYLRDRVQMLSSAPLMRQLRGVRPVTPPIVRTNVFKKNENFRRALELYEYLAAYDAPGYAIETEAAEGRAMPDALREDLCALIALGDFMGRLGASDALREELEENFQRENEAAARERARIEAEREQRTLARIAAAREEEIAVRRAEVQAREAVIADLNAQNAALNRERAELRARLEDERARHAREAEAQRLESEAEIGRMREAASRAQAQYRQDLRGLEERHREALARQQDALAEQRRAAAQEQEAAQGARQALAEREREWQRRMDALRREQARRSAEALEAQRLKADARISALEAERRRLKRKLEHAAGEKKRRRSGGALRGLFRRKG